MKENKATIFIRKYLFLFGGSMGLIVFFSFLMPLFKTNEVVFVDALVKGSSQIVYINDIFSNSNGNGFLWPFIVIYSLPLLGLACSLLGKINRKFHEISLAFYLLAGIFFLSGSVFYDYSKSLSVIGSSFLEYLSDWRLLADTSLSVGIIWASVFSFFGFLINLSAAYEKRRFSLRDLLEIAILCAIAIVLDVIQHLLPSINGLSGSIGIATLPLLYIALRHGPLAGFIGGGIIYGLITCLTDGSGIVFYPFDYLLGFGSAAVMGFFKPLILKNKKGYNFIGELFILIGCLSSGFVRFVGSSLSSMVNYGYGLVPAMAYNVVYVFGSSVLVAIILMALYGPLLRLEKSFPTGKSNN